MSDVFDKNIHITTQQFEDVLPTIVFDGEHVASWNQSNHIAYHDDQTNDINHPKSSFYLYSTFQESLSNKQTNNISVDPKEWIIMDSTSGKLRPPRQNEFLLLLLTKSHYSSYISWINKDQGLCKIHQPQQVATLWEKVKKRQTSKDMNYDTFARGIRFYYKSGLMLKTHKKHILRFKLTLNTTS